MGYDSDMNNNEKESEELVTVEEDLDNSIWGNVFLVPQVIFGICILYWLIASWFFDAELGDPEIPWWFFLILFFSCLLVFATKIYTTHWSNTPRYRKRRYKVKSSKEDVRVSKEAPKESSMSDELKNLNQLHKDGILSDEEFKKAKEKLLS